MNNAEPGEQQREYTAYSRGEGIRRFVFPLSFALHRANAANFELTMKEFP